MLTFTDNPRLGIDAMTFADYQKVEGVNQSLLRLYDRNSGGAPAKYRHACLHPEDRPEPSRAMEFGSAYHCLSLTPEEFDRRYVVRTAEVEDECFTMAQLEKSKAKGFSTKLKSYERWVALQEEQGKLVITAKQEAQLQAMRAALLESPEVREVGLFQTYRDAFEVSLFAPFTFKSGEKLQLKGRLDILSPGDAIVDIKTSRSAHPRQFARQVADMSMHIQAAFYLDLANANNLPKKRFGFLAQDKESPFLCCIHWMPDEWVALGRVHYQKILLDIAESIRLNRWEGYESGVLEPPSWIMAEIEAVAA